MAKNSKRKQIAEKINNNKVFKTIRIIKDVFLISLLLVLIGFVIVTLIARINGETPVLFGHAIYRVSSGSMVPYLQVGDIILCSDCDPMELKDGDIITYDGTEGEFAGKKVTHRVVKEPYINENNGEYYLVTKGDNNPVEDSPIRITQVTGRFVCKIELLRELYNFFVTPWGLLILISLIILAFSNEIYCFAKALLGKDEDEGEDINEIIERIEREDAE